MSGSRARNARYGARPALTAREAFSAREDTDPDGPPPVWRRETPPNDDDGMDITEVIEAVYSNPDLNRVAAALPERSKKQPGCPADYPSWALVGYGALLNEYGSARAAHLALRVSHNWQLVLRTVAATAGQTRSTGSARRPASGARTATTGTTGPRSTSSSPPASKRATSRSPSRRPSSRDCSTPTRPSRTPAPTSARPSTATAR